MHYSDDKFFLGILTLISVVASWLGSFFAPDDVRWLCVCLAISFMTSTLLSLIFRKPDEKMQLVAARCGITILGSLFATRLAVHYFNIESAHTDLINLGGVNFMVVIGIYFLGFSGLKYLENRSDWLFKQWIDTKTRNLLREEKARSRE